MDRNSSTSQCRDSGCGPDSRMPSITLNISTTTGKNFSVDANVNVTIESLKKIVGKKLKVAKDRICLLHRERELQDGSLKDNGLMDGSKIILIPNVETGLLAQRPENTVMQALESLNDSQVNDFLSGKTPLNLSMRLGDHMMLIQLQLSTVNPSSPSHNGSLRSRSQRSSGQHAITTNASSSSAADGISSSQIQSPPKKLELNAKNRHHKERRGIFVTEDGIFRRSSTTQIQSKSPVQSASSSSSSTANGGSDLKSFMSKQDFDNSPCPYGIIKKTPHANSSIETDDHLSTNESGGNSLEQSHNLSCCSTDVSNGFNTDGLLEQSPIKSLSNLVSSPIKTTPLKNIPIGSNTGSSGSSNSAKISNPTEKSLASVCPDPISAKLTSCLCKKLENNINSCGPNQCQSLQDISTSTQLNPIERSASCLVNPISLSNVKASNSSSPSSLHKTANNIIGKSKQRHQHNYHHHHHSSAASSNVFKKAIVDSSFSSNVCHDKTNNIALGSDKSVASSICEIDESVSTLSTTDNRALAEASRNLTQTLRKLSKEVFTSKVDLTEETQRKSGSGAVIESMKNHGKGIYSGTFSGTLNPALQDRYGRPKRDISTVIHILNDLLSATPQYSRSAQISLEATNSNRSEKESIIKLHSISPSHENCGKCKSTTVRTCTYGECNGHGHCSGMNLIPRSASSSSSTITEDKTSANHHHCGDQHLHYYNHSHNSPAAVNTCDCQRHTSSGGDIQTVCHSNCGKASSVLQTTSFDATSKDEKKNCMCSLPSASDTPDCNSSQCRDKIICSKCTVELENNKTKFKLDQLRLVMQQRKQRREARKMKGAPYGARVLSTTSNATTSATTSSGNAIAPLNATSEVSPPAHIAEEVDTVA